ncbi:asparagine synthase (glutamine-hydrolyzing) [Thioalkalicoccus limnaeus]|uniref:asparagine synthase (glutamine-hydrolyzing) n=1 Tax=Thioalkalicoccus limnaeus TaxID=120681 RepID=A0ABV4BFF5_9GAMM
MCAIAGLLCEPGRFDASTLERILLAMRDTMTHRGPDDAGIWIDPAGGCGLAHRRLAIIDLSHEGRQPLGNRDATVQVTFNGEIYNYQTLRRGLERTGHRLRTRTDTEVLPYLFEDLDPAHLHELDGMFAFGLWHRERRRLLLARDPFGKKPLYYARGPGWFAFASELTALTQVPGFTDAIDGEALEFYLLLQYVPAPHSIYEAARKLPPGCWMTVDLAGDRLTVAEATRYTRFEPAEPARFGGPSTPERLEELRARVRDAVQKRLVSDVPLGAFLSGGVDSALVAAMVTRELDQPLATFSIGFEGADDSEHLYAREVARHLGTEHHEERLRPDTLHLVPEIAERLDEPNGDSSCLPTYLLCRYTRQHVTVALSGDGGDELFGGYGRYRDTLREAGHPLRSLWPAVRNRRRYRPADGYLSPRWLIFQPDEVAALTGGLSATVEGCVEGWRRDLNASRQPLLHRMRHLDAETYLPGAVLAKVDRMSMQVALEVRCPLLDRSVAELAAGLPAAALWRPPAETKRLLKALASRYLPAGWMNRPKMGFGLPSNSWSRDAMLGLARDLLAASDTRLATLVEPGRLRQLIAQQADPGRFSIYQLWPLLILELWLRRGGRSHR